MSNPDPLAQSQMQTLVLIGNIAAQWSQLEYLLSNTIWVLLGLDKETGKIVTGGLDMLPRANMAITLARHKKAPRSLVETLVKIRKEVQDELAENRNAAIHGVQFLTDEGTVTFEVHRGKGGRQQRPLSVTMLNNTGKRLYELSNELRLVLVAEATALRLALLHVARNIEQTVSLELGPAPSGSNSQNS